MQTSQAKTPWLWVPSLYFAQAIPYVVAMSLATVMYNDLGVSNTEMAFYTSLLYLPWVIKPLWSPIVDMLGTKRRWTILLQAVVAASLLGLGFALNLPSFFMISLAVMWVMAFSSATHDISADGFYMLGLRQKDQAAFVGVRSTFYRLATIVGGGQIPILAGLLTGYLGSKHQAWSISFFVLAAIFTAACIWHAFVLPRPDSDHAIKRGANPLGDFFGTFVAFFRKRDIWLIVGFILTFRLGEAQLLKLVAPFMKDSLAKGGLGLSTTQYGLAYGTVGIIALTIGGLAGGYLISRIGLKRALWLMVLAVHLPDLVFVYLSQAQPQNFYVICAFLTVEQFGYGFGFTAMMLYMIMVSDGEHKTAHYAICTGLMALGMMVPGMWSGALQEYLGYKNFFIWTCLATIPAFVMAGLVKIDPEFGKK
ncbi:AmpG family muropeptide MFS transporter [Massilia sp. Dwa41.01b]|uniref:MFS transporter n=1 Tax=unclassified Massilia TaxID=2609279 RepID=UPI0016033972|nr:MULTISPECIES: MFS transporter [unclassified Massilia]QNA87347.1 AmpG family muropeptide MFS transporter [Massilia sp. Dwa41.01b]QNA98252.1 AmpG family muropeptide MFS transporter [Massilia sp. Se16.2.3]